MPLWSGGKKPHNIDATILVNSKNRSFKTFTKLKKTFTLLGKN